MHVFIPRKPPSVKYVQTEVFLVLHTVLEEFCCYHGCIECHPGFQWPNTISCIVILQDETLRCYICSDKHCKLSHTPG